jgi:uncharacterized protein
MKINSIENELKIKYLVIKVASRCNLNCTYCYMYNLGDNSYLKQPKVMSRKVVNMIISKALSHAKRKGIDFFVFSFHGGEPLLAGKDFFKYFVNQADSMFLPEGIQPYFALQTNGVLLTEDWCNHFSELGIEITISLDGDKATNDRYRIDHKGRGSYDKVVKGLKIAKSLMNNVQPPGILSVIDINSDPIKVYNHFKSLDIHWFDMNHPDANYDSVPANYSFSPNNTPYADWLIKMFDIWFAESKEDKKPQIRLFEDIVRSVLGFMQSTDALGNHRSEVLVVETDGGLEAVDTLKACGDGFTKNNLNILYNEFDEVFKDDLVELYENSHEMLPAKCMVCPIKDICGGGYLPHRYSSENGFNNPSIYCNDWLKLILHIRNKVIGLLPERNRIEYNLKPILYHEAIEIIEFLEKDYVSPFQEALEKFKRVKQEIIEMPFVVV